MPLAQLPILELLDVCYQHPASNTSLNIKLACEIRVQRIKNIIEKYPETDKLQFPLWYRFMKYIRPNPNKKSNVY